MSLSNDGDAIQRALNDLVDAIENEIELKKERKRAGKISNTTTVSQASRHLVEAIGSLVMNQVRHPS